MNIYQRIILVLGAAALLAAILTTPRIVIVQGTYVKLTEEIVNVLSETHWQPMVSWPTALINSLGVIGITVLLFLALKGEIKKRAKKAKPKKTPAKK